MTNKKFSNTECSRKRSLEIQNETVIGEQKLIHELNSYYTVIVQNTSGIIPLNLGIINPAFKDIKN